jgi:hypothetical protein
MARIEMATLTNNEPAIWARLIEREAGDLEPTAARFILQLNFTELDRRRMNELAEKARKGTLTDEEQDEIESYNHVSHSLALLHSKARTSLKTAGLDA